MPLQKPAWERALPSVVPARNIRKPLTIEESLQTGYRKRLDMTGLETVMQSEDSSRLQLYEGTPEADRDADGDEKVDQ